MEETRLTRLEIERPDFPLSADGYDREAVDDHLRRVAALKSKPDDARASWRLSIAMAAEVRSIGESAAARVEEIVGVAERSAAEVVRRAEEQAAATLEAAEESAATIRQQALETAARATEQAERQALAARDRAQAQADELREAIVTASALLERLGSASTLVGEVQAISERMGAAGVPEVEAGGDDDDDTPDPEAPPAPTDLGVDTEEETKPRTAAVWFSKLGRDRDEAEEEEEEAVEASPNGAADSIEETAEAAADEAVEADRPTSTIGGGGAAVDEGAAPPNEDRSKRNQKAYRSHKMRVTAFNMLVHGSDREEVAQHLRESLELTDEDDELLEATLEEAAGRAAGWRAVPDSIPRRRRFLGR